MAKISIQVDTIVLLQGVYDALEEKQISVEFHNKVLAAIYKVSYPGPVKRSVCDYDRLLVALSQVDGEWIELNRLWMYLGNSLASGITVIKQPIE